MRFERITSLQIDSYNYFLGQGLTNIIDYLNQIQINEKCSSHYTYIWLSNAQICRPRCVWRSHTNLLIYPRDCREMDSTYKGEFVIKISHKSDYGKIQLFRKSLGSIPVMVRSKACWLYNRTQKQLIAEGEENNEFGGYFICRGVERLIRILISPRRNYITAMKKEIYLKKCIGYTDAVCTFRCVRFDSISHTIRFHYLFDGTVDVAFIINQIEYFLPVGIVIKCFINVSDDEILEKLILSYSNSSNYNSINIDDHVKFIKEKVELMIQLTSRKGLKTHIQCLSYVGNYFRKIFGSKTGHLMLSMGLSF